MQGASNEPGIPMSLVVCSSSRERTPPGSRECSATIRSSTLSLSKIALHYPYNRPFSTLHNAVRSVAILISRMRTIRPQCIRKTFAKQHPHTLWLWAVRMRRHAARRKQCTCNFPTLRGNPAPRQPITYTPMTLRDRQWWHHASDHVTFVPSPSMARCGDRQWENMSQ